ncbi:MAG: uncharacterized protein KVP18_000493 [Porospora cf. gigantea A]|uniref:uncharacterized protein n=1 Tax=Porospora cf. gigantea A TaxID=2853593 RepID=UPI00355A7423|nr:MAG: hypothetical protein KVP18_000493 [Porospora cf. gigantea A]
MAQSIKLKMRGAPHIYMGLKEVKALQSGDVPKLLVSGIQSPEEEYCLHVADGRITEEFAPITLDTCTYGVAAFDGRDLWRYNRNLQLQLVVAMDAKVRPLCVEVRDGSSKNGGELQLNICNLSLQEGDGRSQWFFEANDQLRSGLKAPEDSRFCLTFEGTKAGMMDLQKEGEGISARASSSASDSHGAESGIDGKTTTYWSSMAFTDSGPHLVEYSIDLGARQRLSKIQVDWEYPPFTYDVELSDDNEHFAVAESNFANASNTTIDDVGGTQARYVKLKLKQPHPTLGYLPLPGGLGTKQYVYGIRTAKILVNRLKPVVKDCRETAKSDDMRDKFFRVSTGDIDTFAMRKMLAAEGDVKSRMRALSYAVGHVLDTVPKAEECSKENKKDLKDVEDDHKVLQGMGLELRTLEENQLRNSQLKGSLMNAGDARNIPGASCSAIKRRTPTAVTGFYFVEPPCTKEPLRAFCDMEAGVTRVILHRKSQPGLSSKISSVDDVIRTCAEVGLVPVTLKSPADVKQLTNALELLDAIPRPGSLVPMAFDFGCVTGQCEGTWKSAFDRTDVTSSLTNAASAESILSSFGMPVGGVMGGDHDEELGFAKWTNLTASDVSALVCEFPESPSTFETAPISCDTTGEDDLFDLNDVITTVNVICPQHCRDTSEAMVFGNQIYHPSSSICRAAIHMGLKSSSE